MTADRPDRADTLAERVTETLASWMAANGGGFVSVFTVVVEYVDEDGDRSWAVAHAPDQTVPQTLGLLRWHQLHAETMAREQLTGEG